MMPRRHRAIDAVISSLVSYAEGANATRPEPGLLGAAERARPEDILKSTLEKPDARDTTSVQDATPAQGRILAPGDEPVGEVATSGREEGQ